MCVGLVSVSQNLRHRCLWTCQLHRQLIIVDWLSAWATLNPCSYKSDEPKEITLETNGNAKICTGFIICIKDNILVCEVVIFSRNISMAHWFTKCKWVDVKLKVPYCGKWDFHYFILFILFAKSRSRCYRSTEKVYSIHAHSPYSEEPVSTSIWLWCHNDKPTSATPPIHYINCGWFDRYYCTLLQV